MKKAIITLAMAGFIIGACFPNPAQAQGIEFNENWAIVTVVYAVQNGEYDGSTWVDFGVVRKGPDFLSGYISGAVRFGGIRDETPSAFGLDAYYTEDLNTWLDVIVGIGYNEDLAKEEEEEEDRWGAAFLGSLALKVHKPKKNLYGGIGGRLFQDRPGKLKAWAAGAFIGLKL